MKIFHHNHGRHRGQDKHEKNIHDRWEDDDWYLPWKRYKKRSLLEKIVGIFTKRKDD